MTTYGGFEPRQPAPAAVNHDEVAGLMAEFRGLVAAQTTAGERLADVLRDQVADGQVEVLTVIEAGILGLRRECERLTAVGSDVEQRLNAAEQRIAGVVASAVDRVAALVGEVNEVTDAANERLARTADAREQALISAVAESTQELATGLRSLSNGAAAAVNRLQVEVSEAAEAAASRFEATGSAVTERARAELEHVGAAAAAAAARFEVTAGELSERVGEQLAGAGADVAGRVQGELTAAGDAVLTRMAHLLEAMREHTAATAEGAVGLARNMVEYVDTATTRITQQIDSSAESLTAGVSTERLSLGQDLSALLERAEGLLDRWARRESSRSTRWDARVGEMHDRVAGTLSHAAQQLQQQTDALARRDAELERRRVDEFVGALAGILRRPGGRGLRKAVTRAVSEGALVQAPEEGLAQEPTEGDLGAGAHQSTSLGGAPASAHPDSATQVSKPPVKSTARKVPARKARASKASASKASGSKGVAKKAATARKAAGAPTPRKRGSSPVSDEEQT